MDTQDHPGRQVQATGPSAQGTYGAQVLEVPGGSLDLSLGVKPWKAGLLPTWREHLAQAPGRARLPPRRAAAALGPVCRPAASVDACLLKQSDMCFGT